MQLLSQNYRVFTVMVRVYQFSNSHTHAPPLFRPRLRCSSYSLEDDGKCTVRRKCTIEAACGSLRLTVPVHRQL